MEFKFRSMLLVMGLVIVTGALTHQAAGQNRPTPIADTGVVTLGPNQILRVSVAAGDVNGDTDVAVRFRQMRYEPCGNQTAPKLCIAHQTTSPPMVLAANEGGTVDGADYVFWRTIVMSNRRDVKVTGIVFDTSTQRVVTQIIIANTEGDIH